MFFGKNNVLKRFEIFEQKPCFKRNLDLRDNFLLTNESLKSRLECICKTLERCCDITRHDCVLLPVKYLVGSTESRRLLQKSVRTQ